MNEPSKEYSSVIVLNCWINSYTEPYRSYTANGLHSLTAMEKKEIISLVIKMVVAVLTGQ